MHGGNTHEISWNYDHSSSGFDPRSRSFDICSRAARSAGRTESQPEEKAQPAAKQDEKNAQQEDKNTKQEQKNAQQQDKNNQSAEKNAQQEDKNSKQEEKNAQQQQAKPAQRAGGNGGGGIPADRFAANFGREHWFRVSQGDYSNRRFEYGGYSFGFVDAWPSNWLYTQDVFVVEINGVYYLCNPVYPGVNVALSFTM